MRHAAILIALLSITVSANAGVFIGVDNVANPSWDIYLTPSDTAIISLWGDGTTSPPVMFYLGIAEGDPGSLDDSQMIPPRDPEIPPLPPEIPGWESIIEIVFDAPPPPPPWPPLEGKVVDNIIFHCEGLGNVTIGLLDADGELLDSQSIHQIPEPGTIALLGLGIFMLKRRR